MHLTPNRIKKQLERADKLQRIIWRLYSPYKTHRLHIVKASYKAIELIEELEKLLKSIEDTNREELNSGEIKKISAPPGYLTKKSNGEK